MWSVPTSSVSHVAREEPLQPKRIPTVFDNNTNSKAEPMGINEVEGSVHEDVKKVCCLYYHFYNHNRIKSFFFFLFTIIIMANVLQAKNS